MTRKGKGEKILEQQLNKVWSSVGDYNWLQAKSIFVNIFTFSLINVKTPTTNPPAPPAPSLCPLEIKFCCSKLHSYVKISMVSSQLTAFKNLVETSHFELCFLLAVLLQNLHICSFLLILFISYHIWVQYLSGYKPMLAISGDPKLWTRRISITKNER